MAKLGLNQEAYARKAGISLSNLRRVISGYAHLTTQLAHRLQSTTGINALNLLTEQARWELEHLDAGTWPHRAEKKPDVPYDEADDEL